MHDDDRVVALLNAAVRPAPPMADPAAAVLDRVRRRRRTGLLSAVASVVIAGAVAITVAVPLLRPDRAEMERLGPTGASVAQMIGWRWSSLPAAPIPPRLDAATVWTGREMIVWGGSSGGWAGEREEFYRDGAAYDPRLHRWRTLADSPLVSQGAYAVWTGQEMLVWGGCRISSGILTVTNEGAAYNPATDTWRPLPPAPISSGLNPVVAWTGREMLVLGGRPLAAKIGDRPSPSAINSRYTQTGAYDPVTNRWRMLATRPGHGDRPLTSVWTGKSLLLWTVRDWPGTRYGRTDEQVSTRRLWVLDPAENRWTDRLSGAVPRALANASAHWTGDRAIVWGGSVDSPVYRPPLDTPGGVYDPVADRWSTMAGSPVGGSRLAAVWTGRSLLAVDITSGVGAWDPTDNRWTTLSSLSGSLDGGQSAVWTGRELLVWGRSAGHRLPNPAPTGLRFGPPE